MSNCCTEAKVTRVCPDALNYVQKELELEPKNAIISCEGGCIKGEIARVAASILAYRLVRDSAVRICLGDAATGNSGMLELVKRAPQIIAIEGCPLQCGTEIMKYRVPDIETTIVEASSLYTYDKSKYFELLDMPREDVVIYATKVAEYVQSKYFANKSMINSNNNLNNPTQGCD
jgi:uncharacterized metal-binding protein